MLLAVRQQIGEVTTPLCLRLITGAQHHAPLKSLPCARCIIHTRSLPESMTLSLGTFIESAIKIKCQKKISIRITDPPPKKKEPMLLYILLVSSL